MIDISEFEEFSADKILKKSDKKKIENEKKFDIKKCKEYAGNTRGSKIIISEIEKINLRSEILGYWIEPINDDIFNFRVFVDKTNINKLTNNEPGKFSFIIKLNKELYPFYPPSIFFDKLSPSGKLSFDLSNIKMIKLNYWSPTRKLETVITNLITMIEKYPNFQQYFLATNETTLKLSQILIDIIRLEDLSEKVTIDVEDYPINTIKTVDVVNFNKNIDNTKKSEDLKNIKVSTKKKL